MKMIILIMLLASTLFANEKLKTIFPILPKSSEKLAIKYIKDRNIEIVDKFNTLGDRLISTVDCKIEMDGIILTKIRISFQKSKVRTVTYYFTEKTEVPLIALLKKINAEVAMLEDDDGNEYKLCKVGKYFISYTAEDEVLLWAD